MSKSYNNARNPTTKTLGTGYGSKEKAIKTLQIIKKLDKVKQKQIVITMFNRAKFHKYRTRDMESAMKIFSIWMKKHNIKHTFSKTKKLTKSRNSDNTSKYNGKTRKLNIKYVHVCSGKGPTEPPCKKGGKKVVKYKNNLF